MNSNLCLRARVRCVKMRRIVIEEVHSDYDTQEP
jgi:hypothetical protein